VARNQRVRTNLGKPLSPSLVTIRVPFAGGFRDLRYIFATELRRVAFRLSGTKFRISALQKPTVSRSLPSDSKRIFRDIPKISERIDMEPFSRGDPGAVAVGIVLVAGDVALGVGNGRN
jgi:hypothetical protein